VALQDLLASRGEGGAETAIPGPNTGSNIKVAKPPMFNRETSRVSL